MPSTSQEERSGVPMALVLFGLGVWTVWRHPQPTGSAMGQWLFWGGLVAGITGALTLVIELHPTFAAFRKTWGYVVAGVIAVLLAVTLYIDFGIG